MEKLVLRGIMYGADKIPDKFFDAIPGGYYKPKAVEQSASKMSNRQRRYSDEYDSPRRVDGPPARSRGTYEDDEDLYEERARQQRRPARDGYDSSPRREHYPPSASYDEYDRLDPRTGTSARPPPSGRLDPATATAATTAGAAVANKAMDDADKREETTPYNGYMPYSNLYGTSSSDARSSTFSPSRSVAGSVQPHNMNSLTFSPDHRRSPEPRYYADRNDASRGAPNPPSDFNRSYQNDRSNNRYDDRSTDRHYEDYDYDRRDQRARPSLRRRSYDDSFDSRDVPWRSPSPNRPSDTQSSRQSERSRGKSLGRVKEQFDSSNRGLGYSAVGALAGAVIGNNIGKGAVPAAVGAAIGGLGANIFEARERKKDAARKQDGDRYDDARPRRDQRDRDRDRDRDRERQRDHSPY